MSEVVFGELPQRATRRVVTPEDLRRVQALRDNPGVWGRVFAFSSEELGDKAKGRATGTTQAVRTGRKGFEPAGAFETAQRIEVTESGTLHVVWVRYVGEDAAAQPAE